MGVDWSLKSNLNLFLGGVVNILTGGHDHMAKYMAEHHDLESVWYFGTQEGKIIWTSFYGEWGIWTKVKVCLVVE